MRTGLVNRPLVACLVLAIAWLGVSSSVCADMVGAQEYLAAEEASEARDRIASHLEREAVRDQLQAHGVDPDEAEQRVAALSDEEATKLAAELDELPAGGGAGDLISAALFVFVVLLITDILGFTDVFPFTK